MAGYRCVNYHELCRLCTNSSGTKINIFSEEGKKLKLYHKITECLPITLNERDKLPKIICSQCLQQVETIAEFRETCINAENMLESCLDTPKIRNGGKVYIKDVGTKKPQQQHKQPIMITKLSGGNTNMQGTTTTTTQADSLSSIIQEVGIYNIEDSIDAQPITQPQPVQIQTQTPQYTLTFDGQTLKTNQIQYKIEEQPTYTIAEPEIKSSQSSLASVTEFLKLNSKTTIVKKDQSTMKNIKTQPAQQNINLVLTTPQKQVKQTSVAGQPQQHHIVLPIQFKDTNSTEQQIISNKNIVMPTHYLQMKLPPQFTTVDGQQVIHLTPANIQLQSGQSQIQSSPQITYTTANASSGNTNITPTFRLTTSSSQAQNSLQQQLQTLTIPAGNLQLTTVPASNNTITTKQLPQIQLQTPEGQKKFIKTLKSEPTTIGSTQITLKSNKTQHQQQQAVSSVQKQGIVIKTEKGKIGGNITTVVTNKLATQQQQTPTPTVSTSNTPQSTSSPQNPAAITCETCGKLFKRKEHLVQHMKLHIGLRPFTCNEAGCNKAFSRKEHLMRHIVSHTGKKMFSCELCQKLFSRKDNLNKHKRTHPEYVSSTADNSKNTTATTTTITASGTSTANKGSNNYVCDVCSKVFAVKHYYMEHKKLHANGESIKVEENKEPPKKTLKRMKITPRKQQAVTTTSVATSTVATGTLQTNMQGITIKQEPDNKPQLVQIRLAPQTISSSGATKNHDTTVLTLPSSIGNIVSINSNFLTQDSFGNYKIDV